MTPEGHAMVAKLSANLQYSVDIAEDNNIRKEASELLEQLSEDLKVILNILLVMENGLHR